MKHISNIPSFARRAVLIFVFFTLSLYAQEYTVGVPVCDTISTLNVYAHNDFCDDRFDDTLKIMLQSNLIPYVTGLQFQFQIAAVNGRISSNVSDTVKAGDDFSLPATNASGIYKFVTTPNSSFVYTTKIIGVPLVANENYPCDIQEAMTAAVCNNTLSYFGQGQRCSVKPVTAVEEFTGAHLEHGLAQNYPNPLRASLLNSETTIRFQLPAPAEVTVKIYNAMGQPIRILAEGKRTAGAHQLTWDGRDDRGLRVSGGVYFYAIRAGAFRQTRKIVFLQ